MIKYKHDASLAVLRCMKYCMVRINPPSLKLWRAFFALRAKNEKLNGGANVTHQTV